MGRFYKALLTVFTSFLRILYIRRFIGLRKFYDPEYRNSVSAVHANYTAAAVNAYRVLGKGIFPKTLRLYPETLSAVKGKYT
jgi:hypothetical protein